MNPFAVIRVPHSTLHIALLVLGLSYLVNVLSHGFLSTWLALAPELVRSGQWWRILSYPLAIRNFFDMAATGIVLYLFAADFERSLGTARLWRFTVLVLLTNGILYTIVLYAVPIPLESPLALILALLTWKTIREAQQPVSFFGWFTLLLWQLWLLIAGLSLVPRLLQLATTPLMLLYIITVHGFGIAAGILLHVLTASSEEPSALAPDGTSYRELRRKHQPEEMTAAEEEELNALLDKIATSGYQSLSWKEKRRLRELSRKV